MRRLAACAILFASPFALLAANSSDGTPDMHVAATTPGATRSAAFGYPLPLAAIP
jgi:hypothetical protein